MKKQESGPAPRAEAPGNDRAPSGRGHNRVLILITTITPLALCGCQVFGSGKQSANPPPDPVRQSTRPELAMQAPAPPVAEKKAPDQPTDAGQDAQLAAVEQYVQRVQSSGESERTSPSERIIPTGPAAQRPPTNALFASAPPRSQAAPFAVPLEPDASNGSAQLAADEERAQVTVVRESALEPVAQPARPVVGRVTVRPAPESPPTPARPTGVAGVNSPVETSQIPTSLKGFLDQYVRESEAGTFRQQLDERILRVLVGDDGAARLSLQLVSDEQQKLATGIIEALISSRQSHPEDPSAIGESSLQALTQLSGALRDLSVLRVPTVALCWKVEGFGRYEEFNPPKFLAARESELIVYSEVAGFASTPDEQNWFRTSFDVTATLIDRVGNVAARFEAKDLVDRCRNRRNDCFIPHLIRLPATLPPGEYVVKVTIADKLGRQVAENRTKLTVVTSL